MAKKRGVIAHTELSREMFEGIIEGLFPRHDPSPWLPFVGHPGTGAGDEERVIDVELAGIAKSLSVGKAPRSDVIPNQALKVAIAQAPEIQVCYAEMPGQGFFLRSMEKAEPGSITKSGETTIGI